jgi:hypothetical protein
MLQLHRKQVSNKEKEKKKKQRAFEMNSENINEWTAAESSIA